MSEGEQRRRQKDRHKTSTITGSRASRFTPTCGRGRALYHCGAKPHAGDAQGPHGLREKRGSSSTRPIGWGVRSLPSRATRI